MKLITKLTRFSHVSLLLIGTFITSLALAQNADDELMKEYNQRLTALENKQKNRRLEINPSAGPKAGIFLSADVLYLQAQENGLEYCILFSPGPFQPVPGSVNNDLIAPDFDWDFAFRLGAGYNFKRDGWDIGLNWLHLHTDAIDRKLVGTDKVLFPVWTAPFLANPFVFNASANLKIKLNLLDLELGRAFYVSKHLVIKPFGGLIAAWVDQDYKVEYSDSPNIFQDAHKMENNFSGTGLVAGGRSRWFLGKSFSIYGDVLGALMYGEFQLSHDEFLTQPQQAPIDFDFDQKFHLTRALVNFALGLRWEENFSQGRYRAAVQLGYEFFLFFGQNQLFRFVDSQNQGAVVSNQGDLTLQGGVFSAHFDF